jgi:hypothetical protein
MNSNYFTLTASDRVLLTAALADDAEAVTRAWQQWREATDLDVLPEGQYLPLPKLYANLLRCGLADAGDPRIKGVYRRTWYANQRLGELAAAALAALGGAGVPAALSGAAAVQDLYGGPGERPIGQVELLVAPDDAARAAVALGRAGWRPVRPAELLADPGYRLWVHQAIFHLTPRPPFDRLRAGSLLGGEGESLSSRPPLLEEGESLTPSLRGRGQGGRLPLALAWRPLLAAPAPGDAARFIALALDAGATPLCLRREAQLLVACARAAEGGPGRLIALADAALILRTPLDWGLVLELAGLLAAARPLAEALLLIEEIQPAPVGDALQGTGFAAVAAISNRRAELLTRLASLAQYEPPCGRARFHLRRWRRIARGQGAALTPGSLLRYLRAAAGVARLRHLPGRLWQAVAHGRP